MNPTRIPLFPLDLVLFPGMLLPLHIFEPRYKAMIGRCIAENIEFGVVLSGEDRVAKTGCTAEIAQKLKDYPDGRMDILTSGRTVFQLIELLQEKEYHEALVEFLPDEVFPEDPRSEGRLIDVFQKCHTLVFGQPWDASGRDADTPLTYQLAAQLPLELESKQKLLETRDENERRILLMSEINEILPQIVERQRMRKVASGNGHRLN
jgi:ATP-dependent Lon protease